MPPDNRRILADGLFRKEITMLFQKNTKKDAELLAVANGTAIPLSEVPDEVFASGMLGVGFAVNPTDGTVYSPVSGKIESITESKHAYTIQTDDGLDVLVHIGIDTVSLKGEGFLPMVKTGNRIKAGDILARVDLNLLHEKKHPTVIPVIVTNAEKISVKEVRTGAVIGGKECILRYKIKK